MLSRTLLHIYGPFSIYTFGAIIAIGCIIVYLLMLRDKRCKALINSEQLVNVFSVSIVSAVIGGRILHLMGSYKSITGWRDAFALHEGGFSILGAIIALLAVIPWYLKKNNIRTLPFMDLMALYAPFLQAISRLGCFFAGCCYGKPTQAFWGVVYKTQDTLAPVFCKIHPTQLYMAAGDLFIFLILQTVGQLILKRPGQLVCVYLALSSFNRFLIDFWRDDQEFLPIASLRIFSLHQWLALGIIIISMGCFIIISQKDRAL